MEEEGLEERFPLYSEVDNPETDVVAPFSQGSFFGDRFRIDDILGTGAMGTVFRATDLKSDDTVALKVLLKARHDEDARERFAREVEILSSLNHPSIVGIRGFGHAHGRVPWLAMELIEGESLGSMVRRAGALQPNDFQPILKAICEPLDVAHLAGVVHRDLKPDHVLVTDDRRVKIIDFGLSSIAKGKKLTATGTVIGTPRYMAPELLSSARNASSASDVYALAVITYEALTGESPFTASDHGQLLGAIMQGKTQPLSAHLPDYPAIDDLLKRAMAKDPEQRPKSAREFANAFALAAGVRPSHTGGFSTQRNSQVSVPKTASWVGWAIGGVIAAIIGGVVGYFFLR